MILTTVTAGAAVNAVQDGLRAGGTLVLVGVPESLNINPVPPTFGSRAVKGWYSGTSIDLAGHAGVLGADRRQIDERGLPAGARRGGL